MRRTRRIGRIAPGAELASSRRPVKDLCYTFGTPPAEEASSGARGVPKV
jgi:hypothetical protein